MKKAFTRRSKVPEQTRAWETKVFNERIISFTAEKFRVFQLVVTLEDGKKVTSDLMRLDDWANYKYSILNNSISEEPILQWKTSGFWFFGYTELLILPLLFTVLVEWLIALAFRIRPYKYVLIINVITNLCMNVLLCAVIGYTGMSYTMTVFILEVLVAGTEYLYYLRKYRTDEEITKRKLFVFTVVANLASWLGYWGLQFFLWGK